MPVIIEVILWMLLGQAVTFLIGVSHARCGFLKTVQKALDYYDALESNLPSGDPRKLPLLTGYLKAIGHFQSGKIPTPDEAKVEILIAETAGLK